MTLKHYALLARASGEIYTVFGENVIDAARRLDDATGDDLDVVYQEVPEDRVDAWLNSVSYGYTVFDAPLGWNPEDVDRCLVFDLPIAGRVHIVRK